MLKYSLQLLISLTVILVVGCAGVPTPKIVLDDVDEIRPLTEEEIKENEDLIAEFKKRQDILRKRATDNIAEKKELVKEKAAIPTEARVTTDCSRKRNVVISAIAPMKPG